MPKLTAIEFQEKHARRLKNSVEDIRRGVAAVTESPMEKAANAEQKMLDRLTAKVQDGTWARRLRAVTLADWKTAMLNKGVGRIAAGIDGAKEKVISFAGQLLAFEETLQAKTNAMPDVTIEDSGARMLAWMHGMHGFKRE